MTSFKDLSGQQWDVRIALGELLKIKARLGVALVDLSDEDRIAKRAAADIARVASNIELFTDLLWLLVEQQAAAAHIERDAWVSQFDGQVLMDAMDAVNEELAVFSLPGEMKALGRQVTRERTKAVVAKATEVLTSRLDALATPTPAELARLEREIRGDGESPNSATASPA